MMFSAEEYHTNRLRFVRKALKEKLKICMYCEYPQGSSRTWCSDPTHRLEYPLAFPLYNPICKWTWIYRVDELYEYHHEDGTELIVDHQMSSDELDELCRGLDPLRGKGIEYNENTGDNSGS